MKKILILSFVALFAELTFASVDINWNTGGNFLYNSSGAQLTGGGLFIQLVIDVNDDTDFNGIISSGMLGIGTETALGGTHASADDDVVGTWTAGQWYWAGTYGNHNLSVAVASDVGNANTTRDFYFRWFDAATQDAATEAGFISNPTAFVAPAIDDNMAVDIGFGVAGNQGPDSSAVTGGTNDGWATVAPVPEPTTMALMGLGLAAVAVRRKFAKKA
jgi:hypothetical protein